MPRPTKLTPELLASFCDEIRKGKPKRAAAGGLNVHRDTVATWERVGKQARGKLLENVPITAHEKLCLAALDEIQVAFDGGESWLFDKLLEGGKDWQRFARILESTRPDIWLRRYRLDHGNAEGKALQLSALDIGKLTGTERATLRELLKKSSGAE